MTALIWVVNIEVIRDGAYGLSSLSKKTRESCHLQMLLERQPFLLSYLRPWVLVRPGYWTRYLPHSCPMPEQLRQPVSGNFSPLLNLTASDIFLVTCPQRLPLSLSTNLRMCCTWNLATIKIRGKLTCPKLTVLSNEIIELIEVVDALLEMKNEKLVYLFNISA